MKTHLALITIASLAAGNAFAQMVPTPPVMPDKPPIIVMGTTATFQAGPTGEIDPNPKNKCFVNKFKPTGECAKTLGNVCGKDIGDMVEMTYCSDANGITSTKLRVNCGKVTKNVNDGKTIDAALMDCLGVTQLQLTNSIKSVPGKK
jgi:hypothetical protein